MRNRSLLPLFALAVSVAAFCDAGLDGDTMIAHPAHEGVDAECGSVPSAMPGWPYDLIWDYDDYDHPFVLGRNGWDQWNGGYMRTFRLGRVDATLHVTDREGWRTAEIETIQRLMGRALATLPAALTQRLPPFTLRIGGTRANATTFFPSTVQFPPRYVHLDERGGTALFLGNSRSNPNFEELLIHELAHVMDNHSATYNDAFHRWSDMPAWQNAMAQSPCTVSRYARTSPSEDFAESVVAWFAYYAGRNGTLAGRQRRELRDRLGKRFGVLNRLMHGRFDTQP